MRDLTSGATKRDGHWFEEQPQETPSPLVGEGRGEGDTVDVAATARLPQLKEASGHSAEATPWDAPSPCPLPRG
ncbi:MAG TPA: hypothetical protein VHB77_18205, partial [Planctomycetaceae bacterium]|nr:hypothetical protein [Planctomycetaceae bacterium]